MAGRCASRASATSTCSIATATSSVALDEFFTVAGGAIVAKNPAQVFDALAKHYGETITLQVDSEEVRFRVGQSGLVVTLAPPPSNPSLPVSKIAVGVSLVGAGIATERVSDAKGRIELKSFPHGTVALECETVSAGLYYYCDAILVHSEQRSVTLVLRHTTDLLKGVPPLKVDQQNESRGTPPSRAGAASRAREGTTAALSVASDEKDVTIMKAETLLVPAATASVFVAYEVATLEQRSHTGFDDVWTLSVFADRGQRIFHTIPEM